MSISVKNLQKNYGEQKAVDAISFEVAAGEIVGFLGPNGAGKSTTMKIATCYIPPSSGEIAVAGYDVLENPIAVKKSVGYLPEHNPLYLDMYVQEYLGFIGHMHGLKGKALRASIGKMVEMCGLGIEKHKKIGMLSKGYRQRVGLAQALIHDPKVLILDEPTTGLDPNQLVEIRQLIAEVSKEKTVLFSTHIMQEVQALCERVIIINRGKIVADDLVSSLGENEQEANYLVAEFAKPVEIDLLKCIEGVLDVALQQGNQYVIKVTTSTDLRAQIFNFASKSENALLELRQERQSLENTFQQLTKGDQ